MSVGHKFSLNIIRTVPGNMEPCDMCALSKSRQPVVQKPYTNGISKLLKDFPTAALV